MKNKLTNFIGIDISKNTLDFALVIDGRVVFYEQIGNTKKAIQALLGSLKKKHDLIIEDTVFCMEYTGIYGNRLINYLSSIGAVIWVESGTHMKRSLGLTRGKNDMLDSQRIADFAFTHAHKMKPFELPRKQIQQLKILSTERKMLLKCKKQKATAINEQILFVDKDLLKQSISRSKQLIKQYDQQLESIESQMNQIIKDDNELSRLYKIVTSVDGIGFVSAIEIIVTTQEFIKISEPKKYACYGGVAPFEHSSGTSVRGRSRVSQMANKEVKTTLHMAALSAITMKGELRDYYLRKVEQGKNKMSIINAVRNKLIQRVFACVKENRLYQKEYEFRFDYP